MFFVPKKYRVKIIVVWVCIKLPRPSIDSWHLKTVVPRSGIRSLALGSRTDPVAVGLAFLPTAAVCTPIVEIESAPVHLTPGRGCPRSPCAVIPHLVRLLHRTLSLSGPRNLGRSLWAGRHFPHVFLGFFLFLSRCFVCDYQLGIFGVADDAVLTGPHNHPGPAVRTSRRQVGRRRDACANILPNRATDVVMKALLY